MKALISPEENPIFHIISWSGNPANPVMEAYPNSCRVAQVEPNEQTFPVADPMFWADCADDVIADQFYYNTATNEILPVVNVPMPTT